MATLQRFLKNGSEAKSSGDFLAGIPVAGGLQCPWRGELALCESSATVPKSTPRLQVHPGLAELSFDPESKPKVASQQENGNCKGKEGVRQTNKPPSEPPIPNGITANVNGPLIYA